MIEPWAWLRLKVSVIERAIQALKERAIHSHFLKKRDEAQRDDEAAEDIKRSLRENRKDER